MRSPRQSAIRLLHLMMVASLVLPAVLFAWASWLNYRHEYAIADERIDRSLDILHEHTLKVFQTVERTIAEVDEVVRDMSGEAIRADQPRLHGRLTRIVDAFPKLRAISSSMATATRSFRASLLTYHRTSAQAIVRISMCT